MFNCFLHFIPKRSHQYPKLMFEVECVDSVRPGPIKKIDIRKVNESTFHNEHQTARTATTATAVTASNAKAPPRPDGCGGSKPIR
jgi:hypothetical protein